jgi:UDP-GlcNAc:undecaprenyl-phosphate GlcNAc-1-phosphate transferase
MPILLLAQETISLHQTVGVVLALLLSTGLTLLLTPWAMRLAERAGALDQPGGRHVHTKPTPRWGGLAMFAGFAITVLVAVGVAVAMAALDGRPGIWENEESRRKLLGLLLGGAIITALGAIDDRFGVPAKIKLLGQVGAACLLPAFGFSFAVVFGYDLTGPVGGPVGMVLTVLWVVAITNAINLIDGLDGLAAGISGLAGLTFVVIALAVKGAPLQGMLAAAVAGACIGFLRHNFNPARVFMGDAGSHFLGFTIGALSVWQNWKVATGVAYAVPILILAVPILDTGFAIIRRLRRRQPIFSADKGHLHHRLLNLGLNQRQVVLIIYVLTALGCALALLLSRTR